MTWSSLPVYLLKVFGGPHRERFSSRRLSVLLPLVVFPLKLFRKELVFGRESYGHPGIIRTDMQAKHVRLPLETLENKHLGADIHGLHQTLSALSSLEVASPLLCTPLRMQCLTSKTNVQWWAFDES